MKKSLITLLILGLLACSLFVSCNSDVSAPEALPKELVSVTFDDGAGSKGLTATLENFNKDEYYWKYAARKADDSGLTSGATATYDEAGAQPVSNGNQGLGSGSGSDYSPYKVPGFSQGLWDFMLFAYRTKNSTTGAYEDLIYSGEAQNVSLTRGGSNTAHVVVNPVSTGNGIIKIGTISFVPKKAGDATSHTKVIEVTNPDGSAVSGITYDSTTQQYTVPAGAYKVTVKFTNSASTIVYAEGYVIATVYPGLKTTVAGDLNELVTYAQFDADLNPDAVNAQALKDAITYDAGAQADDVKLTSATAEKAVSTTVAREDVNSIIEEMAAEQAVPTDASTTKLKLALNVDPTEATQTTVTYEIGMTATLTYKETLESAAQVSEKSVINLDNYIVVEIEMSTGLTQVNVTHSGLNMIECASKNELEAKTGSDDTSLAGYFYYDPAGTLYLKTKKFSPFAISYTAPTNYVASVDGVKYSTLEAAIDKASDTKKVTLLTDVALTSTVNTSKTFEIDLNGYSITAENFRAIWVKEGTLTLSGSGTIAANKAGTSDFSASSSVIRVGDTEGSSVGLVIGANVTVSSSHCYGVTIFGIEENQQSLVDNGKIKVTGTASAISGNGTNTWKPTAITINSGAEVSAENDYAIYQPQAGTLTINGGTISGKGGIEAKAGTVTVNGGVITATAPTTTHSAYGNGPSTSGYALVAVENNGYAGSVVLTINDGTVKGPIGIVEDNEVLSTKKASMSIVAGTFDYDPINYYTYVADSSYVKANSDGTWTVYSDTDTDHVARINSTYYSSLQDAITAASSGDTVELLKNISSKTVLTVVKDVSIEGNYRTVKYASMTSSKRALWIDDDNVELSLKNLVLDGNGQCERGVQVNNGASDDFYDATIEIDNCEIINFTTYAINFCSNTTVNLTVKHSYISGWAAINAYGTGNTITVTGSVLEGINDKGTSSWNNFATICLEGDTTDQTTAHSADYVITISNSMVIAMQTTGNKQAILGFNNHAENSSVEFMNTGFVVGDGCHFGYDYGNTDYPNSLIINGSIIDMPHNVWFDINLNQ